MKRFNVYRLRANGSLWHVTCVYAGNLADAYLEWGISKERRRDYKVSGLSWECGEDISRDFPPHIQRRIENKGKTVKFNGALYPY